MGLAGARTADQHDIVGDVDKVAAVKLPDQRLIDLAAGKVEVGEIAIGREPRHLELIGDGPHLPFGGFCLEELREDRNRRFEGGRPLLHEVGHEIGRASCRERVWQYVLISVVAGTIKNKIQQTVPKIILQKNNTTRIIIEYNTQLTYNN